MCCHETMLGSDVPLSVSLSLS